MTLTAKQLTKLGLNSRQAASILDAETDLDLLMEAGWSIAQARILTNGGATTPRERQRLSVPQAVHLQIAESYQATPATPLLRFGTVDPGVAMAVSFAARAAQKFVPDADAVLTHVRVLSQGFAGSVTVGYAPALQIGNFAAQDLLGKAVFSSNDNGWQELDVPVALTQGEEIWALAGVTSGPGNVMGAQPCPLPTFDGASAVSRPWFAANPNDPLSDTNLDYTLLIEGATGAGEA